MPHHGTVILDIIALFVLMLEVPCFLCGNSSAILKNVIENLFENLNSQRNLATEFDCIFVVSTGPEWLKHSKFWEKKNNNIFLGMYYGIHLKNLSGWSVL